MKALVKLLFPLAEIATQLKRLADMYGMELANREEPLVLATEKPGDDTEISFTGDKEKKTAAQRLAAIFDGEGEDA